VLIGGFEEAAADSDDISSDDESSVTAISPESGVGNRTVSPGRFGGILKCDDRHQVENKDFLKPMPMSPRRPFALKENVHRERERQFAREFGRNISPRNCGKDIGTPVGSRMSQNGAVGGGRDFGRRKDTSNGCMNNNNNNNRNKSGEFRKNGGDFGGRSQNDNGGNDFRQSNDFRRGDGGRQQHHRASDEYRKTGDSPRNDFRPSPSSDYKQNKSGSGSGGDQMTFDDGLDENDKQGGVRGVNIYPAQLKVAIKHMDSLPPRFLRRLQNGNARSGGGGIESEVLRLMSRPQNFEQSTIDSTPKTVSSPTSTSSGEKERNGKSKEVQLQETKKRIRNLLGDLNQYTDEGISAATPAQKDPADQFSTMLPIMPDNGAEAFRGDRQREFDYRSNDVSYGMQRMPPSFYGHQPIGERFLSCEELEQEMLRSKDGMNVMHRTFTSFNPGGFGNYQPARGGNGYYGNDPTGFPYPNGVPRKTQFSVDAPEFVSNLAAGVGGRHFEPSYPNSPGYPGGLQQQFNVARNTCGLPSEYVDDQAGEGMQGAYPGRPYDPMSGTGSGGQNMPPYMVSSPPNTNHVANMNVQNQFYGRYDPPNGYAPRQFPLNPPQFNPQLCSNMRPPPPNIQGGGPPRWGMNGASGGGSVGGMARGHPAMGGTWYPPPPTARFNGGSPYGLEQGAVPNLGEEGAYPRSNGQAAVGAENDWNQYGSASETSSYEAGRQRVLRLLNDGNCVMVILIGGPQGDKMGMVRYENPLELFLKFILY